MFFLTSVKFEYILSSLLNYFILFSFNFNLILLYFILNLFHFYFRFFFLAIEKEFYR